MVCTVCKPRFVSSAMPRSERPGCVQHLSVFFLQLSSNQIANRQANLPQLQLHQIVITRAPRAATPLRRQPA
jgi:hypothetical protein